MPSSKNGGNIEFGVSFKTDSSLDKLKKSLQDLQKVKLGDFKGSANDLDRVKETAQKVESILSRAFNPTLNTTNISTFNNELKKSNLTVEQIKSDFSQFGKEGQLAFSRMASSLLTTNLKLKQTNSLVDKMGKTMVNTVKWGIASSIMNTFTQSVQGAFQYVQSLERSLTNIRIVTGDSTEKMAQFAEQANRSAQALGRSTLDYTKASLTFYQQGLNEEDVQARTEATLKAQNITGAGSQMADYLTSVWNGYKVANEEAELYVDKLAAVADSSASDMSQLAIAMSKVASTASTMGVDIDQLNAQIATVVATTRQAPESVGTAFKTIYTRMNDIKTGADDAEVSLGKYSGTMASLGFNVLDATGHLRDTGQVMEEIGGRWETLTREQQIYLAQTMGGQRQVNQLMALFDNWTTYSELLNTSLESEGTLAEKNARYMESLGAKMEQLGAAGERVKDSLIDTDSMKGIVDILTNVTNLVATLFESIGGGNNVLLAFGSVATQVFGGTISKEIAHMIEGFQNAKANAEILKNDIALTKTFENSQGENTKGLQFVQENMEKLQKYYSVLDESAINEQKNIIDRIGVLKDEQTQLQQNQDAVREYAKRLGEVEESQATFNDSQNFSNTNMALGTLVDNARVLKEQYDILKSSGFTNDKELEKFKTQFQELLDGSEKLGINVDKVRQAFNSGNWAQIGISKIFDEAIQKGELFSTTINKSGNALEDTTNKINNLTSVMKSKQSSFKTLFNVNTAIKFASTVGQIGSIMTSITNLKSIIKNEDLSASEKLAKVLTNISFLLPMIINTSKNISSLLGITNALTQRRLFLEQKISKEKERQALLDKKAEIIEKAKILQDQIKSGKGDTNKALQELKKFKNQDLHLDEQLESIDKYLISIKDKADKLPSAISTAFSAAGSSITSFIGILGSIAVPLLAITAVVTTGYAIYKAYNQASDAAKQAAKNARFAKEEYDEVKESFKDLTSSIEDYADAKNALSELTSGTEQWYNKINELNDKVLQLLQKFPELAKYIKTDENGLLYFEGNGEEEVKNIYRQRAYTAGMANANLQEKSYQAGRNADITEQGRRIYGTLGMFGGKDIMEAVLSAVQKKGTGILGDEEALKAAVADEGINLNKDQIDATMRNTQQIRKLSSSLDAEKTQVGALKDSLVKTNLINEEAYRNSQNKEAFADIVSKAIDEERGNGLKQFEKQQMDMYGKVTKFLDPNAIIERYEELSGNEVQQKGNKISTRRAGSDEEFKETSFAEIKAYVEEASIDMEKILTDATERMAAAQQNFANVSDRVKEVLFNSGLTEGFDKVNAKQFSQEDIKNLQGLNPSDLANYLGISQEDLRKGLKSLGETAKQEVDNFIQGIKNISVKDALIKIQNENQDLSEELAEFIAQQIQDGFNVKDFVGKGQNQRVVGTAISDFYKSISNDELEEATKVAENFDFATGSTQDFIEALRTAGVTSSEISQDVVNNFIEAKRKIQNVQAEEYRSDPTKVAEASDTAGLIQKTANGEKLSDKEIQSMKQGIQELKKMYPQLTQQIETLNQTQLAGTTAYEEAFRNLKAVLLNSYSEIAAQGTFSSEQILDQISSYITTSEDLQKVMSRGILKEEQQHALLISLAAQYSNCKSELEAYNQALQTRDSALIQSAQIGVDVALRSAEQSEKWGLQAQAVEDLANHYRQLWAEEGSGRESIANDAEQVTDAAVRYLRLNEGITSLRDGYKNLEEVLNTLSQYDDIEEVLGSGLGDQFEKVRTAIADMLNTSEEFINGDFIKKYAKQIKKIAEGSEDAEDALAELEKGFGELSTQKLDLPQINIKADLDDDGLIDDIITDKAMLEDWLQNIPEGELFLNDLEAINSLINLMQQAGMSAQEIDRYFRDHNIDLNFDDAYQSLSELPAAVGQSADSAAQAMALDAEVNTEENVSTDNKQMVNQQGSWHPVTAAIVAPNLTSSQAGPFGGVVFNHSSDTTGTIIGQVWETTPEVKNQEAQSSTTVMGIKAISGNKKAYGGGISHKNKKRNTGSGGGKGNKGKGGGGGKGSQPKQAKQIKPETKKADRYHDNTVRANKLANQLTKLNKQQERLTGKDALKNLQKQLEILQKQNKTIKERLHLQRDQQSELQNNLSKFGATFGPDGTLTNYFEVHKKIMDEYNKKVDQWNSMSGQQQQENKDFLNTAKEIMDKALKDLQQYDKLQQDIAKSIQEQVDNAQQQINNRIKQFELKIEASIDLTQAKRDWNEFKRTVIDQIRDDDILGLDRFRIADISTYYNRYGTGSIQQLASGLKELINPNGTMSSMFSESFDTEVYKNFKTRLQRMTVTDRKSFIEQLTKYSDQLKEKLKELKEKVDEIRESVFDAIDALDNTFKQQMDEHEFIGDILEHNMKVIELMYGDEAYNKMAKYYDKVEENNNKELNALAEQKDYWYDLMRTVEDRMKQTPKDSNDYQELEKRRKEYQKLWMDTVKDLQSKTEEALELIADKYANTISQSILNLELNLGNGNKFDDIEDEWDRINDQADMYLDKINSAYEIDKLANAYQDAIKDNDGNIAAQQALNDLMEQQLAYLKDKDKLTQYDVDRANTLLQIEMKRLALEQSRSNKNRLRLRRDSQGNYTYQYTADTQSINKAEQELADAKVSLYNADKAAYVDNLNSIQKSAENIKSRLEDIWKDQNLSHEQKLKKSYELQKYYGDMINDLLTDNASIRNNLIDSAFEDIEKRFGITREQFSQMSKEDQDKYLSMYIPQINSATNSLVDQLFGEGGIKGFVQDFIEAASQADTDRISSLAEVEKQSGEVLQDVVNGTDTLITQSERLLDNNEEQLTTQKDILEGTLRYLSVAQGILEMYSGQEKEIINLLKLVEKTINKDNMDLIGTTQKKENQAAAAQMDYVDKYMDKDVVGDYTERGSSSNNYWASLYGSTSIGVNDLPKNNGETTPQENVQPSDEEYQTILNNAINKEREQQNVSSVNKVVETLNNNVFASIDATLIKILNSSQEYYAKSLANQDDKTKAVIANQNIHIDADFPNAKDVYNIIRAMEDLAAAAAQKAGSTTKLSTASGKVNAGKAVTVRKQKS